MAGLSDSYDVVVAGGGTAGAVAAVASARCGARTLLLEKNQCLGGAATMRNVLTWCGLYTLDGRHVQVVRGIADEILSAQRSLGGLGEITAFRGVFVPFDPETLKVVFDNVTLSSGVDTRFGALVVSAERSGGNMSSVSFAHHGGMETVNANAFVDCTGDGNLANLGGSGTRYGNPDGVNLGTLGCRFGGIPADVSVTLDGVVSAIAAQEFPEGAISKDRGVVVRLPKSGDMVLYLASEDYDPRDGQSLAGAEFGARRQAWRYLEAIRNIPGCGKAYLVSTGPEIGTRESRHLESRKQLKWSHIATGAKFDDTIALGGWGAEWHDRSSFLSEFDYPANRGSFEIPLGCLHSIDTANLFCAGRLADGDRKAGAAIRVMGTCMATGQAAGTAAALTADGNFSVENTQAALRKAGAVISSKELQLLE